MAHQDWHVPYHEERNERVRLSDKSGTKGCNRLRARQSIFDFDYEGSLGCKLEFRALSSRKVQALFAHVAAFFLKYTYYHAANITTFIYLLISKK